MTTTIHALFATLFFAIAAPIAAQNAAPSVESRLREQLKGMAVQLKTAEMEKATLQAEKTALTEKATSFETASKKLGEQLVAETDKAKKESETLNTKIAEKEAEIAETKAALVKATE